MKKPNEGGRLKSSKPKAERPPKIQTFSAEVSSVVVQGAQLLTGVPKLLAQVARNHPAVCGTNCRM